MEQGPSGEPVGDGSGESTLYVRNTSPSQAWVGVLQVGQLPGAIGFWGDGNIGVGCFGMAIGDRLVLLDRSPQEAGATAVRALHTRGQELGPPVLWIDLGDNGRITEGRGVPAWWAGDPRVC